MNNFIEALIYVIVAFITTVIFLLIVFAIRWAIRQAKEICETMRQIEEDSEKFRENNHH